MNGNPFPVRSCVPVSTAEEPQIPVVDWDLGPSSSQEWADDLLSEIPTYLILGHLTRIRGAQWEQAGVMNVRRAS
jgi:hypothetical protein